VKRPFLRNGMAVAAAAALLSVPALGTAAGATASGPVYGGTLNLATQFPPPHLDPGQADDGVSIQFSVLSFDNLVTYAPTSSKLVGDLATHWKILDGGKEYVFYLRHGVTFSNGDPLTAQDVVFTFTRLNEAATANAYQSSYSDIVGAPALFAGKAKTLSGIRAVGKYEVVMHLSQPELYWLNVIALPSAAIEDAKVAANWNAMEKAGKPITPIGTGPFILQPVTANSTEYVYVKNPHYWQKGLPYVNRVVIHIGPSPTLQMQQFQRGQLAAIPPIISVLNLTSAQYLQVRKSPSLKKEYWNIPSPGTYYLGFNANVKPWNSLYLRQAVEYAINKTFLNEVLNNSRALVANSVLPPGIPGYEPTYDPYPVNDSTPQGVAAAQAKAKALLAKAGYPHGLNAGTFYVPEFGDPQGLAATVKEQLAAVGIQVQPRLITLQAFFSLMTKPKAIGFYWLQWGQDYPDAEDFLYNLFDSAQSGNNNVDWYKNPKVDALLAQADTGQNQAQRVRLYDEVQHIVMSQAAVVPLTYSWADGLIGPNVYPKTPLIWSNVAPGFIQAWRIWIAK